MLAHEPSITRAAKASIIGQWRAAFGVPLNDPRMRTITVHQARLDIANLLALSGAESDNDQWFEQVAREERLQPDVVPAELPDAPSADEGNTSEEAAWKRLKTMRRMINEAPPQDDEEWEVVR